MVKRVFFIIILALLPLSLFANRVTLAQSQSFFKEQELYFQLNPLGEEGSREEKKTLDHIKTTLNSLKVNFEIESLDKSTINHSFSKNLLVTLPGNSEEELIIVAPLNRVENKNSSLNISLALCLINYWKDRERDTQLTVLFSGADYNNPNYIGSHIFLDNYNFKNKTALIYLLFKSQNSFPQLVCFSSKQNAPGWFVEESIKKFQENSISLNINLIDLLVNRVGVKTNEIPIDTFLKEGIPAIALISSKKGDGNLNILNLLKSINDIFSHLKFSYKNNWQYNYLIFKGRTEVFFLPEGKILQIYLALLGLIFIFPIFSERKVRYNLKRLRPHILWVPVIFYLVFLFFMVSTLTIEEILSFRDIAELWLINPILFFLLKISLSIFLSGIMITILRSLHFPKNPHFYSYTAFLFSLINLTVLSLANISFTPIMLWGVLFTFLHTSSKGKISKLLFALLSTVPSLIALVALFNQDYPQIFKFLTIERITGNLSLTLFTFPLICMLTAINFYNHHYNKNRKELQAVFVTILWGALSIYLIIKTLSLSPYTPKNPQKVLMIDNIDLDSKNRSLKLESSRKIGKGSLFFENKKIPLNNIDKELTIKGHIKEEYLEIDLEQNEYLDRRQINFTLLTKEPPHKIEVTIFSEKTLLIYRSPFPFFLSKDGKKATLSIGINPPSPLNFSLIFNKQSRPSFQFIIKYQNNPFILQLEKPYTLIKRKRILSKTIPFRDIP